MYDDFKSVFGGGNWFFF